MFADLTPITRAGNNNTDYNFRAPVVLNCLPGYWAIGSSPDTFFTATCEANRTWTLSAPGCEGNKTKQVDDNIVTHNPDDNRHGNWFIKVVRLVA